MKNYLSVVHDFYEVQSARGVYITSVREDGMYIEGLGYECITSLYMIDGHITSRISFNRGRSWSKLKPTRCVSQHLHKLSVVNFYLAGGAVL